MGQPMLIPRTTRRALSLIELVVAVVIIGIVAAMAVPRFSRAAGQGAPAELRSRLAALRSAIELYYYDHGVYPGQHAAGPDGGAGAAAAFVAHLTLATNEAGAVSLGPYLRSGVPACPVGPAAGREGIHVVSERAGLRFHADVPQAGWVYCPATGDIVANCDQTDADGVRYDAY